MGFIEPRLGFLASALGASDYMDMAILGSAGTQPTSPSAMAEALLGLTGQLWSPVFQLVEDRIAELIRQDCLALAGTGEEVVLAETGIDRLAELLRRPIQAPLTPFGQVGVRLKLAFLHHLGAEPRRRQIEALIRAYECEVASRCQAWSLNGPLGQRWLDHQMDALEDGIGLLRAMAVEEA